MATYKNGKSLKLVIVSFLIIQIYFIIKNHQYRQRLRILEYIINGYNGSSSWQDKTICFSIGNTENISFPTVMKNFPWTPYEYAVETKNSTEIQRYSTLFLETLIPFLLKSPTVQINNSCQPPFIKIPSTCNQLSKPRKIGLLWHFGFDIDALEIHLNELDSVVDKFFITESIHAHNKVIKSKELLWYKLKFEERFARFSEKVVHFIVDDANLAQIRNPDHIWSREQAEESMQWKKFLEWNEGTDYFNDQDLLGFGDVDEMSSRENVHFIKSCELPSDPLSIGIWFPYDGLDTLFMTDFPVSAEYPHTLGDPTFFTLGSAKKYFNHKGKPPTRMRGVTADYLLGGMHLSRYAYPPFQMAKLFTATESDGATIKTLIEVGKLYSIGNGVEAEEKLNFIANGTRKRIRQMETFLLNPANKEEAQAIVKIPWFLQCNRERYPGFDKRHDSRLE